MRRRTAPLIAGLALLLTGGCRNPFEPSSDIELTRILATGSKQGQGGATILVTASDASSTQPNLRWWTTSFRVVIRNKVSVYLTSASIMYTNEAGDDPTSYRSVSGRNLKFTVFCPGVTDDTSFDMTEGHQTDFDMFIVDKNVLQALKSLQSNITEQPVIFANIVIRGEDENGYDVRLEGQITIQFMR